MAPGITSLDVFAAGEDVQLLYTITATGASSEEPKAFELFHTRSKDGGETWSAPVRVDRGLAPPHAASATNAPQVAGDGKRLAALWSSLGKGFMGRGPLVAAVSDDGGASWRAGAAPPPLAEGGAQAFLDLAVDGDGVFHAVWIADTGVEGDRGLFHARSSDAGASWSTATVVDPQMCQCCWNEAVVSDAGELFTLYRDVAPRDMGVARLGKGGWSLLGAAGSFGWQMEVCPHVGGAIAVSGAETPVVHTLVWTGKEDEIGLFYVRSRDGGRSWDEPRRMGGDDAAHADLARGILDEDTLLAVWDSWEGVTFGSLSRDAGESWSEPVALSPEGVSTRYPLAAIPHGPDFRVFWTEGHEDGDRLATRLVRTSEL